MEDKELQQLFDAKRWQEENQRQQKAIAAATAGHRRWLGWTIAAAVMVGLLGLSPLLRSEEKEPMLVAEAGEVIEEIEAIETIENLEKVENLEDLEDLENPENLEKPEPIPSIESIPSIPSTPSIPSPTQAAPAPATPAAPPTPAAPRVHRRRGTLLAETARQPERPKVSPLIAHYLDIPDSINFTSNIVIPLKK